MKNTTPLQWIAAALITGFVFTFAGLFVKDNEFHTYPVAMHQVANDTHTYETDDTHFLPGEILAPDYVHTGFLMVIDANILNEMIPSDDVTCYGDIADVLRAGTIELCK